MKGRRFRRFVVSTPLAAAALGASLWLAALWPVAADQGRKPDPVKVMTSIAGDLDLQTALPGKKPPTPPPSDAHLHIPGTLAQWVLWGALVVGVVFALFALRDLLPGFRRKRLKPPSGEVQPQTIEAVERMEETGDEADELARRGLLAEAMHMLLLRSLVELRRRLGVTLADSLTSREILKRLTLPEVGREALADLIQRVEFVHFGRRAAGPDDYGACRASYERLIGAMLAPSGQAKAAA